MTWLMPWRAVRTIRAQREDMRLLTLMLAMDVPAASEQLRQTRAAGWWNFPRPLAVALAALMPGRAVEDLRTHQRSLRYLTDRLAAMHQQEAGLAVGLAPHRKLRHLYAVR